MPRTVKEMQARLAFLNKEIAAYPYWGAALTALDEERKALRDKLEAKKETK